MDYKLTKEQEAHLSTLFELFTQSVNSRIILSVVDDGRGNVIFVLMDSGDKKGVIEILNSFIKDLQKEILQDCN